MLSLGFRSILTLVWHLVEYEGTHDMFCQESGLNWGEPLLKPRFRISSLPVQASD